MENEPKKRYSIFGDNPEYLGNIWGWKFSFISLVIILFFTALVLYGHFSGKIDMRTGKPFQNEAPAIIDTIQK
jgi:hypothetical protein